MGLRIRRGRGLLLAAACWAGVAGTGWGAAPQAGGGRPGSWCERLKSAPGTLYQNPVNPWVGEVKLFARVHANCAWVDGESNGDEFWYSNGGEIRRLWPGISAKFAEGALTAHYEMMLEDDEAPRGGDHHLGYDSNWAAYLEWELTRTFPHLDGAGSWTFGYGKRFMPLSEEGANSSKFLPVVERSALSNRLFVLTTNGSGPFGAWLRHKLGRWSTFAAVYSTDTAPYWGNWDAGLDFIVQTERNIADWTGTDAALLSFAAYYSDTAQDEDVLSGAMNWAVSTWSVITEGPWTWRANLAYGEADSTNARRDGRFWGFVGTAEYWIVQDKLEAVARYYYQGAENREGVRLYSRYAQTAGLEANEDIALLRGGYGDDHHALYLGLNWLACGHQLKLLGGIEIEQMKSGATDVYQGVTYWLGLRHFF
jgi:hypothetical protein